MTERIDLDALRAARVHDDEPAPKVLSFAGHEFPLPERRPYALTRAIDLIGGLSARLEALGEPEKRSDAQKEEAADLRSRIGEIQETALRAVFGDDFDRLLLLGIDDDDLHDIITGLAQIYYGVGLGESSASSEPSPSTGSRSRPTSSASTASTSSPAGTTTEPTSVGSEA